jgi:hypothetical protein
MTRWITVPLALLLASCNGVERDLAACKLEMLHSDARPAAQRAHIELCMRSRGWRFKAIERCMIPIAIEHQYQSDCYVSDWWWWVK